MRRIFALIWLALLATSAAATTTVPVPLLNPAGSTAGQAIVSTGPTSAPAWGGVGISGIGTIAANTVLANATSSSASPTAFAMPSCSAAGSSLQYASGTGFSCASGYAMLSGATFTGAVSFSDGITALATNSIAGYAPLASPTFTGTPAAPTASSGTSTTQLATTAFVANSFASPPSVGYGSTTPEPVAATTISATGVITPSQTAGIVGTTTNNVPNAGSVGEVIAASVAGSSAVPLTSGTIANVTSISLTPGDWDVWGNVAFSPSATISEAEGAVSQTSANFPGIIAGGIFIYPYTSGSAALTVGATGATVMRLAATTTVYLTASATFSSGTCAAYGVIYARRRR